MHSNEALAKMFATSDNTLSPDEVGILLSINFLYTLMIILM